MKPDSSVIIGLLIGAAAGYHLRPRIVQVTGGHGDEAVVLERLERCELKLTEISQQLRHAQQLAALYQELYTKLK
jgi:hypothetical protein